MRWKAIMNVDTSVIERGKAQDNVLLTSRERLPDGRYAYTGMPLGIAGARPIGFIDSRLMGLCSMAPAPPTVIQVNGLQINQMVTTEAQDSENKEDSKGVTPANLDKTRTGIGGDFAKGLVSMSVTHLIQKGGATLATSYVANKLGVSSDPNAVAAIGKTLGESEFARIANTLGNVLKILILIFTLWGITFKILGLFFGDEVPAWAWIVSSFINLAIAVLFGMYVYDVGPFAKGPQAMP